MKTESKFINSLIDVGILRVDGALGSYRISFSDNKQYFCDLESSGEMFIRSPYGKFRYFPRDLVEGKRAEFDVQNLESKECKVALMTFSAEQGHSWARHTGYAIIQDSVINEYNIERRLPDYQRNLLPQPWYTQNPTRLTLVALGIDAEFIRNNPDGTNAELAKNEMCFRHAALIPTSEVTAAHIYMDSEIDSRTGVRYHGAGRIAENCSTHTDNILRRYGVYIDEVGKYEEGQVPNSLLLRDKLAELDNYGVKPTVTAVISKEGKALNMPISQYKGVIYIDAIEFYGAFVETKNKPREERFKYNLRDLLEQLSQQGLEFEENGVSFCGKTIPSASNTKIELQYENSPNSKTPLVASLHR